MKKGASIGSIVGLLVAGLLLFGSAVGVSFGGTSRISDPVDFELTSKGLDGPGAVFNQYPLRDTQGRRTGFVGTAKIPNYEDAEGNRVAEDRISCTDTDHVGVICTHVWSIDAGPYTERGTVTLSGIFRSLDAGTVNHYAVTGGTGAYQNARGYVTEKVGRDWVVTFHLLP